MGGLAPGRDLLDEPIVAPIRDLPIDEGSDKGPGGPRFADLPLWYAALVEPPRPDKLEAVTEPGTPPGRLFWRSVVARWPIERRQAWGDLANAMQDAGLGWNDAERSAFEQIRSCLLSMKG